MVGFSRVFSSLGESLEYLSDLKVPLRSPERVLEAAEKKGGLDVEDVASLIALRQNLEARALVHTGAVRARERWAEQTVEFIIPVYLTSFCQNDCLYCGYRKGNPLAERVRLSLIDLEKELDVILSWGHRQIELVTSDDPEFTADSLAECVQLTRRKIDALGGGLVALCSPVYGEDEYRRLRQAGLDWVAEWQETYHQPHFDRWHFPGSAKRDFDFRLDVWDRAVSAGINRVALGVLFGLYDWRFDVLAVIAHGNYLRREYGFEPHALGVPRLKPARGVLASQKPSRFTVSDDDFRFIVDLYHLAFPRSRIFFNTRETYELNWPLVGPGDLFTVDCETLPGGYLRTHLPGQFSTHYYPSRREVAAEIQRRGLTYRYLAPEQPSPVIETAPPPKVDLKRWEQEHLEICERLKEWESALSRLQNMREDERWAAMVALRGVLNFFETRVVEHFRYEETVLFRKLEDQIAHDLRSEHDRFGIDLDKFERQLVSYELSHDPTVLLRIGGRATAELRRHMEKERHMLLPKPGTPQA